MRPILFTVGSLNFYSYGFFTALGFIVAGMVIGRLARRKRFVTRRDQEQFLVDGLLLTLAAAIVAARLSYIILYSFVFRTESIELSADLLTGGFTFYGGLLAGLAAFSWWVRKMEGSLLRWLDIAMAGLLAGIGLSEVGGYLNDGSVVHLAAFVGSWALAAIVYAIVVTDKRLGQAFWFGILSTLTLFFFLGFWREELVMTIGLTLTQWASLAGLVLLGLYRWWLSRGNE